MITDNGIRTSECCKTTVTRVCWAAVLAGALVGVGLGFLLNLFSMAIGLSAYSSTPTGAEVLAIGGVIGLLIGVIAAMGTAGFVSGYLGRFHHCYCHGGVLYGFITWSLALMLSAVLIIPMSHYVSFYEENLSPSVASVEMTNAIAGNNAMTGEQNPAQNVSAHTQAKNLAWSGWILFGLFFIGALSSCIGACYGMRCKREEINPNIPLH